ncbi:hypothetical protein MHYP_G00148770 [Metynnis hypsauchen]
MNRDAKHRRSAASLINPGAFIVLPRQRPKPIARQQAGNHREPPHSTPPSSESHEAISQSALVLMTAPTCLYNLLPGLIKAAANQPSEEVFLAAAH